MKKDAQRENAARAADHANLLEQITAVAAATVSECRRLVEMRDVQILSLARAIAAFSQQQPALVKSNQAQPTGNTLFDALLARNKNL